MRTPLILAAAISLAITDPVPAQTRKPQADHNSLFDIVTPTAKVPTISYREVPKHFTAKPTITPSDFKPEPIVKLPEPEAPPAAVKQDREVPDSGKVPTIRPFDIEIGPFDLDSSGRTAAVWWWNPKTDPFMESLKPDAGKVNTVRTIRIREVIPLPRPRP